MPWRIVQGVPTKMNRVQSVPPQEVTLRSDSPQADLDVYLCPECDREYKTEAGRDSHLADKH